MNDETKRKISNSLKGRKKTKEHIANVVAAKKRNGTKPWNYGLKTYKTCLHCGKEFEVQNRYTKHKRDKVKFCSMACRTDYAAKHKDMEFHKYRLHVWRVTKKQPLHTLEYFEKRGKARKGEDNYQVDHIVSIEEGYKKSINPEVIGHIDNLRMIHWLENIKRRYENKSNTAG